MGKRRIRNLQTIGIKNIKGFDLRSDRRKEVGDKYNISVFETFDQAIAADHYDAFVISVPPLVHHLYMKEAIRHKTHCFVEASVVDTDMAQIINDAEKEGISILPSSTMWFHPAVIEIANMIKDGNLGTITNVIYHCGQYLPDWHTYESVSDYYVSIKETGGAREIVPFELTWLVKLFGFPNKLTGLYKKTIEIKGAESIEDTYNALLDYNGFILNLVIDVVSRYATRRLLINGESKQLIWNWDENFIRIYNSEKEEWENKEYNLTSAANGYNKNINEGMYENEMRAFFSHIDQKGTFPNSLENDHRILKLLYSVEESYNTNKFISVQ